jgi:hypothetical protein
MTPWRLPLSQPTQPFGMITEYHSFTNAEEHPQAPLMTIPAEVMPLPKDVEGGAKEEQDDEKVCRICLEDDHPEQMISPCQCKGGSKWVHRECLDLWRINEKDRAFSQCTECLFKYHMVPPKYESATKSKWRRTKFYMLVSRDIILVTLLLQLVIGLLGAVVWLCDSEKSVLEVFCGGTTCPNGDSHAVGVYYLCGFLLLLVVLGLYGSIILSFNQCSIQKSIPTFIDPEQGGTTHIPTQNRSATYQHHRQRYYYSSQNTTTSTTRGGPSHGRRCCDGCCVPYGYHPVYVCDTSGTDDCCCCCNCPAGSHHHVSNCNCGGGDWGGCCKGCDCGGDKDSIHIIFVVLVVAAVIMAVIGFVVGIIIAVVMCQRVIQAHVYLLHKRQLVQEFTVMDLQDYDVLLLPAPGSESESDTPPSSAPPLRQHPPPSAPPMHQEDEIYLQKLGLVEKY